MAREKRPEFRAVGDGKETRDLVMVETIVVEDLQAVYRAGRTYTIKKTKTAGPNSDERRIRALADEWTSDGRAKWLDSE